MIQSKNRAKLKAWSVHLLTATGAIVGFLALEDAFAGRTYDAMLWLLLAVFIDGIDGTFARWFKVKDVLPNFDGKMIDFVVDFLNFVITPTVIFYHEKMVSEVFLFPLVAGILYASLYHYGNKNQLTADFRFKGFPAFWNLVIYYLLLLQLGQTANLIVIIVFIALHFLPVPFLYLSRMRRNIILSIIALAGVVVFNTIALLQFPMVSVESKISMVIPLFILFILGMVNKEIIPQIALKKSRK